MAIHLEMLISEDKWNSTELDGVMKNRMTAVHVWVAVIVATILLMLIHLMIRFGSEGLNHVGTTAIMPGVIAEMELSGNYLAGFGDWRSPFVINAVTWLLCWAAVILGIKLWRLIVGR